MPLDNWKLSFPSQMLPDVVAWASDHLPARCPKATEEKSCQFLVCCIP